MTLSAYQLTLGYQSNIIIPSVSLTLHAGEITCLVGANGCGKSTLLKALAGVLKPRQGTITLNEKPLKDWSKKALAKEIAFLPQDPMAPDDISVYQLVSHGRFAYQGLLGKVTQKDVDAIENALKLTGMTKYKHRSFNHLSGGERQRGWLALCIAQQAKLLLLDEPTTYLDIGHQYEILSLLRALNQQQQLTIAMVLHDINQASQFADRIVTLQHGNIITDDTPINAVNEKMMMKVFGIDVEMQTRRDGNKIYPLAIPLGAR
ncbi:iron dicitrate ABC transporter ATP-binding protein [Enterovibrio norvegicus]|uniref:Iron complex transport system ATP-binding protein n=2 Tax=Enterovibrio norvegicus TaxID=188144 RepID=A0A1I5LHG3_9GAMM|nr:ABC transporter ATP-binding protein [Enterovibrio norvegicus]OEF49688.1 iron dicitrate ABC transporter ATP-binding protein [Enterovibrio norvegicus]OEF58058.1 iron dicitrate ABC transporter ATP-binding protein [Enterovibrio norvegicus]SFO96617.1 iron complex transport system ATP-binding protein [Enterovibrio norvegicus DSM 15893]